MLHRAPFRSESERTQDPTYTQIRFFRSGSLPTTSSRSSRQLSRRRSLVADLRLKLRTTPRRCSRAVESDRSCKGQQCVRLRQWDQCLACETGPMWPCRANGAIARPSLVFCAVRKEIMEWAFGGAVLHPCLQRLAQLSSRLACSLLN